MKAHVLSKELMAEFGAESKNSEASCLLVNLNFNLPANLRSTKLYA